MYDWKTEMILAYVPEAEFSSFDEALDLAFERDERAAQALASDCEE